MHSKQACRIGLLIFHTIFIVLFAIAQQDSSKKPIDSFLLHQKGLLGKLAKNLVANQPPEPSAPVRKDLLLSRYKGKIIRTIIIRRLDFGTPISDTSKSFKSTLTRMANAVHHKTRENIIRNNLLFKTGDIVDPALLADNEKHLRDLSFLQDARISVANVSGDYVDIIVYTKDVLSLGGSIQMTNNDQGTMSIYEDNLAGLGNKVLLRALFDNERDPKFGYGGEYTERNIGGSFIDAYGGLITFNKNINTGKQSERMVYGGFIRPFVFPQMKFTYAAEFAVHKTYNVFPQDSMYNSDHSYTYKNFDGWVGWNTGAFRMFGLSHDNRLRTLLATRILKKDFETIPERFNHEYSFLYANIDAVLTSLSIFRQDFYTTQYVYGFGRNEDVPEGLDVSLTGGWTKTAGIERGYLGFDFLRYYFTKRESYLNYGIRAGGFYRDKHFEDVNLILSLDYFSRLVELGAWKLRNFVNTSFSYQPSLKLNEPLFLQSDLGLREFRSDTSLTGTKRATIRAESVFFAPWRPANFRFAPFVFVDASYFNPVEKTYLNANIYTSLGGGVRMRNESLIFETAEVRAYYFPKNDFRGNSWRVVFNTQLRFKYNQPTIKKPDFVNVNSQ
jgi:hypothetical protein